MGINGKSLITADGWFMEKNDMWPGQAMSLKVKEVIHHSQSDFQDILIFESETYKKVLVLDGVIQLTERDEYAYHEMMSHLPLFCHENPKNVLLIGGGDGGVIRELLKHDAHVESITICEIDKAVMDLSEKYIPSVSQNSLKNPKVKIVIDDGTKFLENHENEFDIIITDSSDPVGPAKVLFELPFYKKLYNALKPNGIICSQGECIWLHVDWIQPLLASCRSIFPVVSYAYTTIPTYPSGQIGFILCSKNPNCQFNQPLRLDDCKKLSKSLKYYNADIHRASFILPEFARKFVEGENDNAPKKEES